MDNNTTQQQIDNLLEQAESYRDAMRWAQEEHDHVGALDAATRLARTETQISRLVRLQGAR